MLFLAFMLFRLVKAPDQKANDKDCLSEESCKQIYIGLYVALNNIVQYVRSIISLKGGIKVISVRP